VLPFRGEGPRISIAFNLRISKLSLKKPKGVGKAGEADADSVPAPAGTSRGGA
jgi:hypothetical protein